MPEEIFDCQWRNLVSNLRLLLINFYFCQDDLDPKGQTHVASRSFKLLLGAHEVKSGKANIDDMPLGDMFRDGQFSPEEYELPQNGKNIFYSNTYLKRVRDHITKL